MEMCWRICWAKLTHKLAQAAAQDEEAVLVFSGGFTRVEAGSRSEASSYWLVADSADWFGHSTVRSRTLVEV
jgi:hypothetical protein